MPDLDLLDLLYWLITPCGITGILLFRQQEASLTDIRRFSEPIWRRLFFWRPH